MIVDVSVGTAGTSRQYAVVATLVSQTLFTSHLSEDFRQSREQRLRSLIGLTGILRPAARF